MKNRYLVALGLTFFLGSNVAKSAVLNGHAFLAKLNSSEGEQIMFAAGYIASVVDTWNNRKEPAYGNRCFLMPSGVTVAEMVPLVKYYMESMPAILDYTASYTVWLALAARYPGKDCTN